MVDGIAKTPRYVLIAGSYPACPAILQAASDVPTIAIYGFSDKPEYDVFLSANSLAMTPYPLVKGFLKNQIEQDVNSLKLVVLEAESTVERCLYAATFSSVLEALQLGLDTVAVSHRLVLDEVSSGYRMEHFPCSP